MLVVVNDLRSAFVCIVIRYCIAIAVVTPHAWQWQVVRVTILMLDMGNYKEINEVYATCKYYLYISVVHSRTQSPIRM